jgi:hypothetical protein
MAATKQRRPSAPLLTLKVIGPEVRPGRISIPELLAICQHAQAAVTRQAEALEGRQTRHRGPAIGKVKDACTLELVSLGKGSATLGLEPARAQAHLPHVSGLAEDAILGVTQAIADLSEGSAAPVDPGVLDSLRSLGQVFDDGVTSVQWIARPGHGRKRLVATFDARVCTRLGQRLKGPSTRPIAIDGVLEMADFRPSDYRCRIHPTVGGAIGCTFGARLADEVYRLLRQPVHVEGIANENTQTHKTESIDITLVTPLHPLAADAGSFVRGWSLDELARIQGVEPMRDLAVLAGGWPDDEDVDEALADIYARRE